MSAKCMIRSLGGVAVATFQYRVLVVLTFDVQRASGPGCEYADDLVLHVVAHEERHGHRLDPLRPFPRFFS